MSLEKVKAAFAVLPTYSSMSLQLLRIKTSQRTGTCYTGREIILSPEGKLKSFTSEISERYTKPDKGVLCAFNSVTNYDGCSIGHTIYRLKTDNALIGEEYRAFSTAIATPDSEIDPFEFDAHAYLLKGEISLNGEQNPVKLISMQNPVTVLKHKFAQSNGTFREISDKVLSLRPTIDVLIVGNTIYMLTLAGENLFNMERAYRTVCIEKISVINECSIVTDFEAFSATASSGHNPRKFVSFNDSHLKKLKNASSRKKMARKFNIPLDGDKFDTTRPGVADKLVKLLCARGMVDPFDDNPMEVAGSKKWE